MISAVLIILCIVILGALARYYKADAEKGWEIAAKCADDADEADARSVDAFVAVSPLIEKSDWTTGSYNGQILDLQRREAARNNSVDAARKALWEIPAIKAHIREVGIDGSQK